MTPDSLFFLWNNALVCPPPNCYCPIANENIFCILKSIVQQNIQYCCKQCLFKIDCSCILKALFLNMQTLWGLALLTLQNSKLCVITQTLLHFRKVCRQARLNLAGYFCGLHYATVCSRLNYCMLSTLWTELSCYVMDCFR